MKYGKPEFIRSDNCGEFVAEHLQDWSERLVSNRSKSIREALEKTATTNDLTAFFAMKSYTSSGSTALNRISL